jgi:hypothetical protein
MQAYIQRWNIIKKSTENVSDERAIDAFANGLSRKDFIEELGRANPKIVSHLMDIANRWADGEDAFHNKRARSPKRIVSSAATIKGEGTATLMTMKDPVSGCLFRK